MFHKSYMGSSHDIYKIFLNIVRFVDMLDEMHIDSM